MTKKALTDAEYEEQRREQFMRDVGIAEYNVGNTDDEVTELCEATEEQ